MSDTPKNEDEQVVPNNDSPTIFELIDWIFHAGAPIGETEDFAEDESDEDESQNGLQDGRLGT